MKIAFLAAANSIHGVRWVKYFADKGHQIIWVSLAPPIPEAEDLIKKINFYEITPSPLSDVNGRFAICVLPLAVRQLKKILREIKPDLLHVHSAGTYGLLGALSGFHPIVLTPWGTDILLTSPLKKPLVGWIVRSADTYTCDGENTRQRLIELGAAPEKIHLIRFGTDVEKFKPAQYKEVEPPYGGSTSKKLKVISLRSLVPIYDIETLIRAAAIIHKEFKNVEFIIAGDGSQKERLIRLAEELNLNLTKSDFVRFTGRINNEELPKYFRSADIYVSTALSDSGLSASTAEAMASGLPVIVTDSGDNKMWVEENRGGFIIPSSNPEILAEKLIYLINNDAERVRFGAYNRKIIEEKNNYYIEMAKTEELYNKVAFSSL